MLSQLFLQLFGEKPSTISALTKAGSNRSYFRLSTDSISVIGVIGTSTEENRAFIYLAQHFRECGLPVPKVLAVSDDALYYLQEDLGSVSLFDNRKNLELLERTIYLLPDFQYRGANGLDFSKCYPVAEFDAQSVMWDLNYFKYCFLNTTGVAYSEGLLENDFKKIAKTVGEDSGETFMYRDFQSRNVMIKDGKPYFIDFQGGRRGPAIYDLVSFVNQARADYSPEIKTALIERYKESASRYVEIKEEEFNKKFQFYSLLRNIQVLGAYGFRGRFERKPHFLSSTRQALKSLSGLLKQNFEGLPYLQSTLQRMVEKELDTDTPSIIQEKSALTVTVYSFSYKKGFPEDASGNGGGFVFDCRGMDNPGRYEQYKPLTGLDKDVIDFLESRGEIQAFLDNCKNLVVPTIENYIRRGFSSLQICFGCTGGRHRSVYCAQHLAESIKSSYPGITVRLIHREQQIDKTL